MTRAILPDPARTSIPPKPAGPACLLRDRDPEFGDCGECVHPPVPPEFYAYDFGADEDDGVDIVERATQAAPNFWEWAA